MLQKSIDNSFEKGEKLITHAMLILCLAITTTTNRVSVSLGFGLVEHNLKAWNQIVKWLSIGRPGC